MVAAPHQNQPITNALGLMTARFRSWTQELTRVVPMRGTGSPEAVVVALENQFYVDTAGGTGAVLYVKRDADIAGDRSKGWILV